MDKEYFRVDASAYVPGKNFSVVRPASLAQPKSGAVMFITAENISKAEVFSSVENCLVFWPERQAVLSTLADRHAVFVCENPHNSKVMENVAMVTGTLLLGSVTIERNGYVASALVRNQCTIGEGVLVGLGAVVVKDVPAGETVVGNPARPIRKKES